MCPWLVGLAWLGVGWVGEMCEWIGWLVGLKKSVNKHKCKQIILQIINHNWLKTWITHKKAG